MRDSSPSNRFCGNTIAGFLAAFVLFSGFGTELAHGKCGRAVNGSAWKYASTAELINWDGRWWADPSLGSEMLGESHSDPEAKPCSHCGGRPADKKGEPVPATVVRVDSQTVVFGSQTSLTDQNTPPPYDVVLSNDFLRSRELEVAKRPPKNLLSFAA